MYQVLITRWVTTPIFSFSSPAVAAILLNQYCTYSQIFQPPKYYSCSVGQKKLTKNHLIFSWPYKKIGIFLIPFPCLCQSSLRSGLMEGSSADLRASFSLSCWSQWCITWKITSRSLLKKVYISQTRKNSACLLQVSNQHQSGENVEQAKEPSLIIRQGN